VYGAITGVVTGGVACDDEPPEHPRNAKNKAVVKIIVFIMFISPVFNY
jgi:hypothetical protein